MPSPPASDDLFRRFRPGAAKAAPARPPGIDEDSGLAYRQGQAVHPLSESEVLAALDRIPALPVVMVRLLRQVGESSSTAGELEDLIRQDMVIAGRVLKLVNSPFYALSAPVASISQAVAIIGFSSLRSLVLAASTTQVMSLDLSCYGFTPEGLWRNSMATAELARAIAIGTQVKAEEAEEYFVAGLLRDVGFLVLGPLLAERGVSLRNENGKGDILRRERSFVGYDHCWVGERIAERWSLPANLLGCIAKHHRIPTDVDAKTMRQLAAVRLAERLIYAAKVGVLPDHPFDSHVDGVLIHAAGLDGPAFQKLMVRVPDIIHAAEQIGE